MDVCSDNNSTFVYINSPRIQSWINLLVLFKSKQYFFLGLNRVNTSARWEDDFIWFNNKTLHYHEFNPTVTPFKDKDEYHAAIHKNGFWYDVPRQTNAGVVCEYKEGL